MTDNLELEQNAIEAELVETSSEPTDVKSSSAKFALLLSVAALIAIAALGWFGWKAFTSLEKQSAQLALSVQSQSDDMQRVSARAERIDSLLTAQEAIAERIDDLEVSADASSSSVQMFEAHIAALGTQIAGVQKDTNAMSAKLGSNSRRAWLEAEVEFLLRIANQALLFKSDFASATRALQAADERLLGLDDPGFYKVRQAIADEIRAISNTSRPDTFGMALSLAGAIGGVAKLPLYNARPDQFQRAEKKALAEQTQTEERSVKSFAADIWAQVKQLVVVRRDDAPYQPLLTADQTTNLYSNLELKLEAARVALLLGDKVLFDQSLEMANQWLESWFDTKSTSVIALRQRIVELIEQPMVTEIPDISTSLKRLVDVMEARDRSAGDR
ncbi:MAG: uroporphyrin-3 C-methyltransferase [Gammaproteobacteria bacterium]|jgi:uroporphyrin-3 C-methyltransferase